MRVIAAIVCSVWSMWLFSQPAFADKRVALVIGNSAYKNVNRLSNPANDAAAVVAMFRKAGFDSVDLRLDVNAADMRRALRESGTRRAMPMSRWSITPGMASNWMVPTILSR